MRCQGSSCEFYFKPSDRAFYDTYCRPEAHVSYEDLLIGHCLSHVYGDYDVDMIDSTEVIYPYDTRDELQRYIRISLY